MKQALTCTSKEIMVVLEKAYQKNAQFILEKVLQSLYLMLYQTPESQLYH